MRFKNPKSDQIQGFIIKNLSKYPFTEKQISRVFFLRQLLFDPIFEDYRLI